MNENYDNCHHRKTRPTFIYTKSIFFCETFLYTKSQTLFKKLDDIRYVFTYKKPYTLRYGIFMKFLKLAFIYKKHKTLCYVTFLTIKRQTLRTKQDNLRYVFIYKNPPLLRYTVFVEFLKFAEGGGIYLLEKQCTSWVGLELELQCTASVTVNSQREFKKDQICQNFCSKVEGKSQKFFLFPLGYKTKF